MTTIPSTTTHCRFVAPIEELSSRPIVAAARRGTRRSAFTLIEIMTVVVLLSFIILGLMATFNETQRAWRTGLNQSDVLEAGRMATDLIVRDLDSVRPTYLREVANFQVVNSHYYNDPLPNRLYPLIQTYPQTTTAPIEERENLLQELFFFTRENKQWHAIGYKVDSPDDQSMITSGIGTLYRFEEVTNAMNTNSAFAMFTRFLGSPATNGSVPIIDGVVHFVVRNYDTSGFLLQPPVSGPGQTNEPNPNFIYGKNLLVSTWPVAFFSNAIPASVEVELGVLESQTAEQARAMPNTMVRSNYLAKQLGAVHLFRQRISLRNVDPEAYQ